MSKHHNRVRADGNNVIVPDNFGKNLEFCFKFKDTEFFGIKIDYAYLEPLLDDTLLINLTKTSIIPEITFKVREHNEEYNKLINLRVIARKINEIHLPIEDGWYLPFCIEEKFWEQLLDIGLSYKKVIVSCNGAFGRTGTTLGCLWALANKYKLEDETDAIVYIKEKYNSRAIETSIQKLYLRAFTSTLINTRS